MKRLIKNRKGTAEVIGTLLFIVILLFFFTNVYLWHDTATKDMNEMYVKKMNAGMQISNSGSTVTVTATGSNVILSRLWIDTSSAHVYANLQPFNLSLAPGVANALTITIGSGKVNSDGSVNVHYASGSITVNYTLPQNQTPTFTIVNTLGITTST